MAKVTAPMLGFSGAGSIADTVTYARWRGVQYARQHVVPANPQSTAQMLTRDTFATLREIWKRASADAQAPWDAFARGRKFTGMNAFVGENVRVLRAQANMNNLIGSPGAAGGLAYPTFGAAAGAGSGEVVASLTAPTLPTGWTISKAVALAIGQQAPDAIFENIIIVGTDATAPYSITLAGLGASALTVVSGWFVYVKPDGSLAYSVSQTAAATAGA